MGIRHRAERHLLLHAFPQFSGESIGITAHENDLPRPAIALLSQPFRERFRIVGSSHSIEQHRRGGMMGIQLLYCRGSVTHFGHFDGTGPRDAFHIIIEKRAKLRTPRFPQQQKPNLHAASLPRRHSWLSFFCFSPNYTHPYFFRLSSSVLRLMPRIFADRPIWLRVAFKVASMASRSTSSSERAPASGWFPSRLARTWAGRWSASSRSPW